MTIYSFDVPYSSKSQTVIYNKTIIIYEWMDFNADKPNALHNYKCVNAHVLQKGVWFKNDDLSPSHQVMRGFKINENILTTYNLRMPVFFEDLDIAKISKVLLVDKVVGGTRDYLIQLAQKHDKTLIDTKNNVDLVKEQYPEYFI